MVENNAVEMEVKILTARIREITELLIDFSWDREPSSIRRLMMERQDLMDKRRMKLKRA